jgi:hypothetical protein
MTNPRTLLVDLNNLARYPTLGIGYLVAALRRADVRVEVLAPLTYGVAPFVRERPQTLKMYARQRALFATHPLVTPVRDPLRRVYSPGRRPRTRACSSKHATRSSSGDPTCCFCPLTLVSGRRSPRCATWQLLKESR